MDPLSPEKMQPQLQKLTKIGTVHRKLSKFVCVICRGQFKDHISLMQHFRMHNSPKEITDDTKQSLFESKAFEFIECEWCPEVFPNLSKAIEHKFRKHKFAATNYFCKHCGKLFPLKFALDQHMTAEHTAAINVETTNNDYGHTTEFSCNYCAGTFLSKSALDCHEKDAHRVQFLAPIMVAPPSKKIKINNCKEISSVYYCHLCGAEYMVKYNLKKHLQFAHTPDEQTATPKAILKCKVCDAIFYNSKAYSTHNAHHNPDDLYLSNENDRQKVVERVDQDFDIRRVPMVDSLLRANDTTTIKSKIRKTDSNSQNDIENPSQQLVDTVDDGSISPVTIPSDSSDNE